MRFLDAEYLPIKSNLLALSTLHYFSCSAPLSPCVWPVLPSFMQNNQQSQLVHYYCLCKLCALRITAKDESSK